MIEPLPDKLGGEFWFALIMFSLSCAAFAIGILISRSVMIFGSIVAGSAFGYRVVKRMGEVRLAKKLKLDPELARIYYARNP